LASGSVRVCKVADSVATLFEAAPVDARSLAKNALWLLGRHESPGGTLAKRLAHSRTQRKENKLPAFSASSWFSQRSRFAYRQRAFRNGSDPPPLLLPLSRRASQLLLVGYRTRPHRNDLGLTADKSISSMAGTLQMVSLSKFTPYMNTQLSSPRVRSRIRCFCAARAHHSIQPCNRAIVSRQSSITSCCSSAFASDSKSARKRAVGRVSAKRRRHCGGFS